MRLAFTCGPINRPVSESMPEGMSTAITNFFAVLIFSIVCSYSPDAGRVSPVPNRVSTMRSQFSIERSKEERLLMFTSRTVTPRSIADSALTAASVLRSASFPVRSVMTSAPKLSKYRAMTNPSPPLFPFPQKTMTRLLERLLNRFLSAVTTPCPAFSMSVSPEAPYFSMASRSMACISFARATFFIQ